MARTAAWVALPLTVGLVTLAGLGAGANSSTAGFFYLAAVLGLAVWGGWAVGAAASVAATLCLNYFFLPPFGTLAIEDPSNWVALLSFLAASTLVSHLVATARRRAEEAQARRREVETLYDLCFGLFAATRGPGALGEAAARTLRAVGAASGELILLGPAGERETVSAIGDSGEGTPAVELPLGVGGPPVGVLLARGVSAPRAVVEPAARLLALAIERERLLREAAHVEAVRESDTLKTSLLRAVSHDLRTPLTSMRLEIESLDRHLAGPEGHASLRSLAREQERLARRIDNLLALARLEAGLARPRPEPVPPADLFRTARESLSLVLSGREIEVRVEPRCPDLWADPSLTLEVLVNLLENAARASGLAPIELAAHPGPSGRVLLEVRDRGPGVPPGIKRMLQSPLGPPREPGSGDSASGGLGLQIARSFTEAIGGTLALLDRPGGGTVARLDFPAAPEEEA
jgi:two-component system sensor histidine kinase KdpD